MKKIATITFHSSYNYGSCLQAYALQEYVKKIFNGECVYNIINLRTNIQKEMYKNIFEKEGFKNNIKKIININQKENLKIKEKYFEEFIKNKLQITEEYSSLEELKKQKWNYDFYIAGSDQLWNLRAGDFDWSYYLEFVDSDKKISYAASFGPLAESWNEEEKKRIKEDLLKFKNISVRETGSFNNVKELTKIEPEINVDPTMLLTKEEWEKLIPDKKIYNGGKYIFLYNLKGKSITKIVELISKKMNLPIVVSTCGRRYEILNSFKKQYDVGPCEFLNLIKNAELVLSTSFHGTIFSILLQKPFFAINGLEDLRINTLLKKMGLEDRSINLKDYKEKCKKAFDISFIKCEQLLNNEREKSKEYLKKAFELE